MGSFLIECLARSLAVPETDFLSSDGDARCDGSSRNGPLTLFTAIYHTPQSNSPASIASPSGHNQYGRQMYNQAPSHLQQQQSMNNYPPPPQAYPTMPQAGQPSPYAQQAPQHHRRWVQVLVYYCLISKNSIRCRTLANK